MLDETMEIPKSMTQKSLAARGRWLILLAVLAVTACEGVEAEPPPQTTTGTARDQRDRERFGTITGEGPLISFSTDRARAPNEGVGGGIGVNAFLWEATLDTINFMPLASADPFGGLIITDWFQPATTPGERVKLHVQIRDAALRADSVTVSVFRQHRDTTGDWLDAPADASTAREIEDHILTRARELRVASTAAG
ncbi:MAG: DUF3576 domain-containing protein [Geminicoccaceae bacterium]